MTEAVENTYDWWDDLSELQKLHIIEGVEDAEIARTISSEEFWNRLRQ